MSLEAFGDEGLLPQRWEDTAMRQEFDAIRERWDKWIATFGSESGTHEIDQKIDAVSGEMDDLSELMRGPL